MTYATVGAHCVSVGKDDGAFAKDMNYFYSRFNKHDSRFVFDDIISFTKTGGNLHIEEKDVLRVFQCTYVRKSADPDGISGQILNNCATQLCDISTPSIRPLLAYRKALPCGKLLLSKSHSTNPNDFRPVALTSHIMKSFDKIIKTMIMTRRDRLSLRSSAIRISAWERGGGCSRYFNKRCTLSS